MDSIYTVSTLTELLRRAVEESLPFVWVRGEVGNVSHPPSGHIYFTLKDARSQLQCAWFAGRQRGNCGFDPLTGEVYEAPPPRATDMVREGVELLCAGKIDIYAARGQYQLLVELARPAGAGLLALEFEERKARLAALGFFALERKRPLPASPRHVALVTSPGGAAIHDFLEISRDRGLPATIRLFPVQVQGHGAAGQMADAIALINAQAWADVIVLIRGGGSLEDLWAFNEECLAKAVFTSRLPVLAGVGHEVDITLADMTADVRAATPSHAAQLLWRPRAELWRRLDDLQLVLDRAIAARLDDARACLQNQVAALRLLAPAQRILYLEEKWAACRKQMNAACNAALASQGFKLQNLEARLKAVDPKAPLCRGYALLHGEKGLIRSVKDARKGETVRARLGDGELVMNVDDIVHDRAARSLTYRDKENAIPL